ncbi:hypothetical protein LO762_08850 [Actinocorallia sp. API 0066]|uniref:hypothetical protein n=1 Tax=Actinocorallia sp. API 0066 TaxID=2896846 RepID=UPI001E54D7AE|nr:hypothetical protein [Actinocorallia sp. API 0066]MCD0449294.1 hypothetical protein [Actinocorallia sp. API 0066]
MAGKAVEMYAVINGREVSRDALLAWEARRIPKAASKIGLPVPGGTLDERKLAFADAKLALGAEEVKRRLARDLRVSSVISQATGRLSRGRRALCVAELHVTGGNAAEFLRWFNDDGRADYGWSMIAASPDHFLIRTDADGRQEVLETTGGSPSASRFLIDSTDLGSLVSPRRSAYPLEAAGVARTGSGVAIGGVRHQFREEPGGFGALLCVEFPRVIAPSMVAGHRWHLAAEWANWVELAFADAG